MNTFDKLLGTVFKATIVIYVLVFFFEAEFRPDVYRLVSVPLEYCLAAMLVYLGGRWALARLGIFQGGVWKLNARSLLKLLGAISALILLCAGIEYVFHNLSLTHHAMEDLQASSDGRSALGAPIQTGWFILGELHFRGDEGAAVLSIPVRGSKAAGELDVKGVRKDGAWIISDLDLMADGQKTVLRIPH